MIGTILIAAAVAGASPVPAPTTDLEAARHALMAGRADQARTMVARALASGQSGPAVDRLLADLAYASGRDSEALARYQSLHIARSSETGICEPALIAAIRLGEQAAADRMGECALADPVATWRTWNALGVLADINRDWPSADAAYAEADRRASDNAQVLNNRGFSMLLRGQWTAAIGDFERAYALDPSSARTANNLELARSAMAQDLPRRTPGETDSSWASRLNDAGMAAQILGDRPRAVAAFTQALEASNLWYQRAANNLERIGQQ